MRWSTIGVLLSLGLHAGAAASISVLPKNAARKTTTVAVVDKKKERKKEEPKADDKPPPPPPKPIEPPKRAAPKPAPANPPPPPPPAAAPKAVGAAHPVLDALPSLGLSMAGGPGGGGIAVPMPQGDAPPAAGAKAVEGPRPAPKPKDDCTEDPVKPKPTGGVPQGRVKAAAAAAGVEGKIRLELQIDENGNVISARVVSGLGGAVDQAAIADAKGARFTPGTKCGKPVASRIMISMTLRNQD